jgi:3-oxoacyl-[acyl-carrier protein] reductase
MGCSIAVHYRSSAEAASALVEELQGRGVKAEAFEADLTKYDEACWLRPIQNIIYTALTIL